VKRGYGWAGLVLTPPGAEEGRCFEEGHDFCFFCINLHAFSDTPMLAGMKHRLQFARTC